MNRPNIPQTDSIQELADFWDTHDLTDFEDELEEPDGHLLASGGGSPDNTVRLWDVSTGAAVLLDSRVR